MADQLAGLGTARKGLAGALFLLGIDTAYNVYGGTNSSPQTTDVMTDPNRISGLMKYVWIGGGKVVVYTGLASWLARSWWPLIGGLTGGIAMHCLYVHAKNQASDRLVGQGVTAEVSSPPLAGTNGFARTRP